MNRTNIAPTVMWALPKALFKGAWKKIVAKRGQRARKAEARWLNG